MCRHNHYLYGNIESKIIPLLQLPLQPFSNIGPPKKNAVTMLVPAPYSHLQKFKTRHDFLKKFDKTMIFWPSHNIISVYFAK